MKKVIFLLAWLMIGFTVVNAQVSGAQFVETIHDFGQIDEKGGKVSHDFIFTNTSDKAITITRVKASCGCTTPTWTNTPVEPGKTGVVTATYNPSGRPGKFNKTVTVTFAEGNPEKLSIKGEVLRGETNPKNQYPVAMGDLLLKSADINFGNIAMGKTKTISIDAYNNSASPLTPDFKGLPSYIKYTPVAIAAKSAGKMEFTLNTSGMKKYGRTSGSFTYNGANTLEFNADIIDDFASISAEAKNNAGKIGLGTTFMNFNKKTSTVVLKISNSGKTKLNIRAIQSNNPDIEFSKTSLSIKPDKIEEVKVKYPANKIKANVLSDIWVYSDDPNSPIMTVKVKAEP